MHKYDNNFHFLVLNIFGQINISAAGSGSFSGQMLLVRIVENNKNYVYFRSGQVNDELCPAGLGK